MLHPCGPCQREGGYRLRPDGPRYPPTSAIPPYVPESRLSQSEDSRDGSPAWDAEPMCAVHAEGYLAAKQHARVAGERPPPPPGAQDDLDLPL